jgi:DNA polymerase III delta prime subunit
VFSNTKRGEIKRKRKRKQTLLLRAKVEALRANAKAAQLRLKLNKLEEKQFAREREEINATKELEQLERAASLYTPKAVNRTASPILDPRSRANFS